MHLPRVDRYFRYAPVVSEMILVLNDSSRVLSVSRSMLNRVPSGFFISFFPKPYLSLWYSPGFWGYSKNLFPQIRIVANRENMVLLSPLANQMKRFPEIFSTFQIALMRKEMAVNVATRKCGVVHDIKEMQQVVPPNTHETVSCYWIFGSRFILSHDQSKATRWVRETCLIVGHLPLMIIFSQLHCLRRCTTVIHSQRDVRSKKLQLCSMGPLSDPTLVQFQV